MPPAPALFLKVSVTETGCVPEGREHTALNNEDVPGGRGAWVTCRAEGTLRLAWSPTGRGAVPAPRGFLPSGMHGEWMPDYWGYYSSLPRGSEGLSCPLMFP